MQAPRAAPDQSRAPSEVAMHTCGASVKAVKIPRMIETDPYDRTPARTQDDTRAVIRTAADPAAVLHVLIQRRQALLHQESADLKSLRSYAERLAHRLPPQPARTPGPPAGIEILTGTEAAGARLDTMLETAETEVLILDRATRTAGTPGGTAEAAAPQRPAAPERPSAPGRPALTASAACSRAASPYGPSPTGAAPTSPTGHRS